MDDEGDEMHQRISHYTEVYTQQNTSGGKIRKIDGSEYTMKRSEAEDDESHAEEDHGPLVIRERSGDLDYDHDTYDTEQDR